mgnify:CR=1 FL=1
MRAPSVVVLAPALEDGRQFGESVEYLVEKQNTEQFLKPVVEDEAGISGYTDENRPMVEAFLHARQPTENFVDGVSWRS